MKTRDVLPEKNRIAVGDGSADKRQKVAADIAVLVVDVGSFVVRTSADAVVFSGFRHLPSSRSKINDCRAVFENGG
ncbi:hypothetical protein [Rhizobium yanglingense]